MALTDNYILWSWAFFFMVVATGLYIYRSRWIPFLSNIIPEHAYHQLNPSFEGDIEAGLSSDAFSLSENVQGGDSRAGLDVTSKREVLKIMKKQKVNFDEARQLFMVQKLAKNGIAPDGRPMGTIRSSSRVFLVEHLPTISLLRFVFLRSAWAREVFGFGLEFIWLFQFMVLGTFTSYCGPGFIAIALPFACGDERWCCME